QLLMGNYDGIIIEPTHSASSNPNLRYYLNLEKQNIPYIMINAAYDELEPVYLMMDDVKGGYLQTKHLLELGHTKIACMYKGGDAQGQKRLKGYIKAYRESQEAINPQYIITYESANEDTKPLRELDRLLNTAQEKPTAIICYND